MSGYKVCLFLFLLLISSATANAQFDAESLIAPQIGIDLQPEFPRPGEPVTASLNDYSGGTYGSNVTWLIDGKTVESATNQRTAIINAGEAGSPSTIQAVLSLPQGGSRILSATINPIYLDVIIEPQTRVPAFYTGRALPSVGSIVNATALLNNGTRVSSDQVYTWRLNRTVLEGGSIRGRNQISFVMPMGNEAILSLEVTSPEGIPIARRAMLVNSVQPTIEFYEVNSLYGVSSMPISQSLNLVGNTVTVRAEPYFLDSRVFNKPSINVWEIDNQETFPVGGNPYEVTLQRTGVGGFSTLNFHVRDTVQLLQGAEESIRINF